MRALTEFRYLTPRKVLGPCVLRTLNTASVQVAGNRLDPEVKQKQRLTPWKKIHNLRLILGQLPLIQTQWLCG